VDIQQSGPTYALTKRKVEIQLIDVTCGNPATGFTIWVISYVTSVWESEVDDKGPRDLWWWWRWRWWW